VLCLLKDRSQLWCVKASQHDFVADPDDRLSNLLHFVFNDRLLEVAFCLVVILSDHSQSVRLLASCFLGRCDNLLKALKVGVIAFLGLFELLV
jgi:hypothetical protein